MAHVNKAVIEVTGSVPKIHRPEDNTVKSFNTLAQRVMKQNPESIVIPVVYSEQTQRIDMVTPEVLDVISNIRGQ